MNMLMAIAAIAAMCGPRVNSPDTNEASISRRLAKDCQVQIIKCVKAKATPLEDSLITCMQEIK